MITFAHPVRRYMRPEAPAIRTDASLAAAEQEMNARGAQELAVVDESGTLVGRVTWPTLRNALAQSQSPDLAELAEPPALEASPDLPLSEAARRMGLLGTGLAYVVCGGRLMGWLHADDLLEATRENCVATPVRLLSERPVVAASAGTPVEPALREIEQRCADLVIMERGRPVGVLLRHEAGQLDHTAPDVPVSQAMRQPVLVLHRDTPAHEAARQRLSMPARAIVVVDGAGAPVGVVSDADFATLIAESTAARGGPGSVPTPSRSRGAGCADVHAS